MKLRRNRLRASTFSEFPGIYLHCLEDCTIELRNAADQCGILMIPSAHYAPISAWSAETIELTQRCTSSSRSASTITRASGSVPE